MKLRNVNLDTSLRIVLHVDRDILVVTIDTEFHLQNVFVGNSYFCYMTCLST